MGKLLNDYDALIVLEDDITVSPYYYQYACQTIAQYQDDERIAGISLYNFPVDYQNGLPFTPLQADELCTIVGANLAEKAMANLHDLV